MGARWWVSTAGIRRRIAAPIIDQGGDDVLGLKGNQGTLHEETQDFFDIAHTGEFAHVAHAYTETLDKDHGRLEVRRDWITEELGTLSKTERWKGLHSIGMVERECWINEHHRIERRYFMTSIPAQAERFAHPVRGHWRIENQLHWRLDVTFREDATRIRKGNAPAILTPIRHLCVN